MLRELPPLRLLVPLREAALLLRPALPLFAVRDRLLPALLFEDVRVLRPLEPFAEDEPLLLRRLRAGSFLRVVLAMFRSSSSLMESAICLEAPFRLDFDRSPRLADKAAPAAICCFPDFAFGMEPSSSCSRSSETPGDARWFLFNAYG